MKLEDVEKLAKWGPNKEIVTKYGPRLLRVADPTAEFSAAWKAHEQDLRALGFSFRKDPKDGRWVIVQWSKLAEKEIQKRETVKAKSKLAASDFQPPAPEGLEYLPFQRAGIEFILDVFNNGLGCLLADSMGLGKTIQAIGTINAIADVKRVLIICPNTLKINWRNELRKWLTRKFRIAIQKAGEKYYGNHVDILIVNYDIVAKFPQLAESQWDIRILDEAHAIKNPAAVRTKATLKIWSRRKLSMTGTPIENKPIELFTLLNDLDHKRWPSKFTFAKRYCAAKHNGYGWDFKGNSNSEELQDILRSTCMIRRLKSQVLKDLPPKRRQIIEIAVEDEGGLLAREQREFGAKFDALDEQRAKIEVLKAGHDLEGYSSAVKRLREAQGAAFEEMARIRYEIGMAKVGRCLDFIEEARESGKVIVFAHHIDVVNVLRAKFPHAAVITGETKADTRQGEVERFQNDPKCDVFIGNLAAAEGITLTASDHVINVEGQWVPGKLEQMEDRSCRYGQTKSVLCSYLVLEGSLDARMMRACVDKLDVIDKTLDREHKELEYATPPALVPRNQAKPINVRREQLVKIAETLQEQVIEEVRRALGRLAGMDADGAQLINGVGFSKIDVRIGHELANMSRLTPMQGALGLQICKKYRGQLGDGVWAK